MVIHPEEKLPRLISIGWKTDNENNNIIILRLQVDRSRCDEIKVIYDRKRKHGSEKLYQGRSKRRPVSLGHRSHQSDCHNVKEKLVPVCFIGG